MIDRARAWWDAAADLLLGADCPGCARPGAGLCPECRTALGRRGVVRVESPIPTLSALEYDELASRLIDAWKEHQAWGLREVLGDQLARAVAGLMVEEANVGSCLLVPMPSTAAAVRRRGLDVTAALARSAARRLCRTGLDVAVWRGLASQPGLRDQAGLTVAERRSNVSGRFAMRGQPPRGAVVLVDDVVTTGSTIGEAWRVLGEAGVTLLGAAVIADTPRHHG